MAADPCRSRRFSARLSRLSVSVMRRTAALILGGGPAGASAAIVLARAGAPHLLVERSRETGDAICGGFLSWRTLESLARLGVAPEALGPARVTTVRVL